MAYLKGELLQKGFYIGVMSGTSLDGVDVVLCEIDASSCRLVESIDYPMPSLLKEDILRVIATQTTLAEVGRLHHRLGVLFADAIGALLKKSALACEQVQAVGLHGQTLWHAPHGEYPFSMQLGDPTILTARYAISVVADFRSKDIALGGEGAPFAPAFHQFLFGADATTAVVNIGGMANITLLGESLAGYDIGCGNVLLDAWIQKEQGVAFDRDGAWAKSGSIDAPLLEEMLTDPYFSQTPPKSTGREYFHLEWLEKMLANKEKMRAVDIQATLHELVAMTIAGEVKRWGRVRLILSGGGVKNSFLVERIKALLEGCSVEVFGYSDEMEGMCFAWLAFEYMGSRRIALSGVTGAREDTILGVLYR
jgi:anhydro-N-acetylmuramic acid kinase